MKIAIICSKKELPEDQYKHAGYHFATGFKQLGDIVDVFGNNEQDNIDRKYDLYFCVDSSEGYVLRNDLHPLFVYNGDTHMPGGLDRDLQRGSTADVVFNGNFENGVKLLRARGIFSFWLPLGYDSRFDAYTVGTKKDIDVSMVGHPNSQERVALWDILSRNYNSKVGNLDYKEYVDANFRAKIVVNQPTEPWNNIYNNRMIEGMACECMILQRRLTIKSHEIIFKSDVDFVYWDDFVDLREKLDYYLKNDDLRLKIARAGYDKVHCNFSYRQLCTVVKNYYYNWCANGQL